jgi:hypothetical protein
VGYAHEASKPSARYGGRPDLRCSHAPATPRTENSDVAEAVVDGRPADNHVAHSARADSHCGEWKERQRPRLAQLPATRRRHARRSRGRRHQPGATGCSEAMSRQPDIRRVVWVAARRIDVRGLKVLESESVGNRGLPCSLARRGWRDETPDRTIGPPGCSGDVSASRWPVTAHAAVHRQPTIIAPWKEDRDFDTITQRQSRC